MKKINKTQGQDKLTSYAYINPVSSWESFREHRYIDANGKEQSSYQNDKLLMISDQGGLCAYCETKIDNLDPSQQSVEHFHDKSDYPNALNHNWGLDWQNVFVVCKGGGYLKQAQYPLPDNLSCDQHKEHLKHIPAACEGYLLNPLDMIATPCLFDFDKATCHLKPNAIACQVFQPTHNQYPTVEELVKKTIEILNLNCQRLLDQRQAVLCQYNKEIKKIRKNNNPNDFAQLAQRWFIDKWPSFFTTRRCLLGSHAETYLASIKYNG